MQEDVTVRDIERELHTLRDALTAPGQPPRLRTSVLTHIAWIPERWIEAAMGVMAELGERHPSRAILIFPRPADPRDEIHAEVDYRCFIRGGLEQEVCAEVVALVLCGRRAEAPASVVLPLLVSDLPVFLRWRGEPSSQAGQLEQLVGIADRLVVDSREWGDAEAAYARLPELLDRIAVSDIAWARIHPWRVAIAALWPDVAEAETLRVAGPRAEGVLLSRWLGSRLRRDVALELEPAGEIELVEVDGHPVEARAETRTPADLLSDQLEIFGRDPVYEEAVRSFS